MIQHGCKNLKNKEKKMNDIKIECSKCKAKFFTLGREEIICTKCNYKIIVKEIKDLLKNSKAKPLDFIEEPIDSEIDECLIEEEL